MSVQDRCELDRVLLERFRECVGPDRSVLIDPGEQAELTLELLAAAPLRRVREERAA